MCYINVLYDINIKGMVRVKIIYSKKQMYNII